MFNPSMFIRVTSAGDHMPTMIHKDKIVVVFPIPVAEQLANGKTSIVMENGLRVNCTDGIEDVEAMLMPRHN